MKKYIYIFSIVLTLFTVFVFSGCDIFSSDNDNIHTKSYEALTGKFILFNTYDNRISNPSAYFLIDGSSDNFSLKYYENDQLIKEGKFEKIITYKDKIGYWTDNLHFNIKCGNDYEHISTYTESFEPINQFRIIDEYKGGKDDRKYLYSELPFILGTYVREGVSYKEENSNLNSPDYTVPTLENYTSELNGKYQLDEDHYFYFISPNAYESKNGPYKNSYFQYFSSELSKPIEGFAHGITYKESIAPPRIYLTYSTKSSYYESLEDTINALMFGYNTFKEDDTMIDHYGSIEFKDGKLNSFTFEHLSRSWTEEEWNKYLSIEDYNLPDAIIYEYKGGKYIKIDDK